MVKVNCKTPGSDVERRDIWVDDWNKSNVDAVKTSDFDALLTERDALADKLRVTDALYAEACAAAYDRGALLAERDALSKQLAELRESYNEVYRKMANLAGDVGLFRVELRGMTVRAEAAEARVRELEPDAERYRWLRDRVDPREVSEHFVLRGNNVDERISKATDAAIDAALAARGKE